MSGVSCDIFIYILCLRKFAGAAKKEILRFFFLELSLVSAYTTRQGKKLENILALIVPESEGALFRD